MSFFSRSPAASRRPSSSGNVASVDGLPASASASASSGLLDPSSASQPSVNGLPAGASAPSSGASTPSKSSFRGALRSLSSSNNLRAGSQGGSSLLMTGNATAERKGLKREKSNASIRSTVSGTPAGAGSSTPKQAPQWVCQPGHPGNLTAPQASALEELRSTLKDKDNFDLLQLGPDEEWQTVMLLFGVAATRQMLIDAYKYRQKMDIDGLLNGSHAEGDKKKRGELWRFKERDAVAKGGWDMYFHKTDKMQRPIFVQSLAKLDMESVFAITTVERITHFFACTLEDACKTKYGLATEAARAKYGDKFGPVEDNFMIMDLEGIGFATFWAFKGELQKLLATLDSNFPELSARIQIINAPWLFSTIWGYVKGWLPPHTAAKVDIAGTDYAKTLLEWIDAENLPSHLGGTCKCPGEGSCTRSDLGPWNPHNALDGEPGHTITTLTPGPGSQDKVQKEGTVDESTNSTSQDAETLVEKLESVSVDSQGPRGGEMESDIKPVVSVTQAEGGERVSV